MMAFNGDSALHRTVRMAAAGVRSQGPRAQQRKPLRPAGGLRRLPLPVSQRQPGHRRRAGRFRSDNARPILLFGGSGPITRTAQVTILNETLPTAKVDALSSTVQKVADVHSRYMGVPLADRPPSCAWSRSTRSSATASSEWGFATWPTIAMSGSIGNVADSLLAGGENAERACSTSHTKWAITISAR
jgi:hypothetical protein